MSTMMEQECWRIINNLQAELQNSASDNQALRAQLQYAGAAYAYLQAELTALQNIVVLSDGNELHLGSINPRPERLSMCSCGAAPIVPLRTRSRIENNAGVHDDFEDQVLQLHRTGNIDDFRIRPSRIEKQCDTVAQYKTQFIPFIKEDLRCEIAEGLKKILETRAAHRRSPVKSDAVYLPSTGAGVDVRLTLITLRTDMPKVDHSLVKEVIAIKVPGTGELVLGIAHRLDAEDDRGEVAGEDEDEVPDVSLRTPMRVKLNVKMLAETCDKLSHSEQLEWFNLCGLIPAMRQHEACSDTTAPKFMDGILHCTPSPWPAEAALDPERQQRIAALNAQQRSVVNRMCTTAEGGLYNLIGPPGTGKTSTIVQLLAERVRCFPKQKILLTAPSNKAVQVVLEKFLASFGDQFMVASLLGPQDTSRHSQRVCPYTYHGHVLQPLLALHADPVSRMVVAYAAACAEALERVRQLKDRPGLTVSTLAWAPVHQLIGRLTDRMASISVETLATVKDVEGHARATISVIYKARYALEAFMLQKAHIVFATLVSSGKKGLFKTVRHFDCVIVDEAAQALMPETFIPFKFDPALCLLIGDPQQLPGLVHSHALELLGYAESLMGVLTEGQQRPYLERLTTQYRMHPSICKWVSDQFYDGELVADTQLVSRATSRQRLPVTWPLSVLPSAFIDCDFDEKKGKYGDISNAKEARVVMATVQRLLERGVPPNEIGVIAFYAAQVKLLVELRSKLAREFPNMRDLAGKLTISTVDGFQGDERDFILISCVRSCSSAGFLSDHRRINVAMSRAKHARWVFGNASALRQSNSVFTDMWTVDGIKEPTQLVLSTAL
jgi:hypothetical protein